LDAYLIKKEEVHTQTSVSDGLHTPTGNHYGRYGLFTKSQFSLVLKEFRG